MRIGTLPAHKVDGTWQVRLGDLPALTSSEPAPPGRGGVRWGPYRRRLRERLVAGDEPGAWAIVERALVAGSPAQDIHLELMVPVLGEIGDAWATGELDIADEHRASGVAARLIGRLGPSFARRGRKRATVVIGAAAGDQHSIPLAILGDIIRGQGLDVVDLGADTPAESFVESARNRDHVIAVAIGVGSDETIPAAQHAAALLHEQMPGTRVFIGGPAVTSQREAGALGADECGATALDVATRCVELAAG